VFADAIKSARTTLSLSLKPTNSDDYVKMNTESIKEWKTKEVTINI
jgi:hypothetical protein